jgi:hypothetical protein
LEAVRARWEEFRPLGEREEAREGEKMPFDYNDSGEGESEMVVCVRVRPRWVQAPYAL